MTNAKRYKRYSSEFKREAILRAGEEGVTDRAVCDELGISTRQFRRVRELEPGEISKLSVFSWLLGPEKEPLPK